MDSTAQSNLHDDDHYARSFAAFLARLSYPEAIFPWLDTHFEGAHIRSVLCVGAGTGSVELPLLHRLPALAHVDLLEPNVHHAASLEQALDAFGNRGSSPDFSVSVVRALFEQWEPPQGAVYDLVVFCNSLYFLASPGQMIARSFQWLRPKGQVLIIHEHPAGAMYQIQTQYHAQTQTHAGREVYYTAADILADLLLLQTDPNAAVKALDVRLEVADAHLNLEGYPRDVLEFLFETAITSNADYETKKAFVRKRFPSPILPQPYSIITATRVS